MPQNGPGWVDGRRRSLHRDIGAVIGMHYNQVAVWRRRYVEFGLAGLADGERSGRPPVYDHDDVLLLVNTVTEPPLTRRRAGPWRPSPDA